jgi:hypothetical protein
MKMVTFEIQKEKTTAFAEDHSQESFGKAVRRGVGMVEMRW